MATVFSLFLFVQLATVLSRTSAHGRSQLKCQKLRLGGCMEEVLKWFNYLPTRAHPGCKVSCQGESTCIVTLSVVREVGSTVEKAIMCCKADWLVASLPSFHSVQSSFAICEFCAAWEECCEWGHRQVCVNLVSEQSQLCKLRGPPSDSLYKDLAWWAVTWRTLKNHKTVKIGEWLLVQVWALARDNTALRVFEGGILFYWKPVSMYW